MFYSSMKGINRLISKLMSDIYLKVTIEKNWDSQNFSKLKKFVPKSVFGELQLTQISLNFKTSCRNLLSEVWEQNCVWLFYYFNFERNSKIPCILLNKNINFIKNEKESKWEIPHTVFERQTLCISSYKNHKLKVKLWRVGACKRKQRESFVPFILSELNFFNLLVLSQCILYWIHFPNIHTLTYKKHYFI